MPDKKEISTIIKQLKNLEAQKLNFKSNSSEDENKWDKQIQPLIDEIELLLFPYWDYFSQIGSWGENERGMIKGALDAGKPKELCYPDICPRMKLSEVIKEVDRFRHHIETYNLSLNNKDKTKISNAENSKHADDDLNDTERYILEALGDETLIAEELLKKAGYKNNSNSRQTLSSLRKRHIIESTRKGYRRIS